MNDGNIWRKWVSLLKKSGFKCASPSWNGKTFQSCNFYEALEVYMSYIKKLDSKPIIIGHSIGGAIAQKLLEKGYGKAGVFINSGPTKGLSILDKNFILSNLELINPLSKRSNILMGPRWYNKYVTNEMTYSQTVKFINENCLSANRNVLKTIPKVNFEEVKYPLLFIAGGKDKSQPLKLNYKNFKAYKNSDKKEFKVFENATHNIICQNGWEKVANYIINWINETF
ncbi:alpha/beta hydrolase [Apilactobacillus sp. TMW 2.2459]|nr:alpha/beta hydrolase [Apilactobacillus xinyiensis]